MKRAATNPDDYVTPSYRNRPPVTRRRDYLALMRYRYGLSEAELDVLVLRSEGRCEACNDATPGLAVDHCHTSGWARGLLCRSCNTSLGLALESTQRLRGLLDYLDTFDRSNEPRRTRSGVVRTEALPAEPTPRTSPPPKKARRRTGFPRAG